MSELQPLIDLLSAKYGWTPAALGWMSAIRLAVKWFSGGLQRKMTAAVASAAASADPEDDQTWEVLLHSKWYRGLAFALDLVSSIKLPTHADFMALKNKPI